MATVDKNVKERLKNFILDILFPRFCLGCNAEGTYLCDDCKALLDISEHKYCLCNKNALRLPSQNKKGKCKKCSSKTLSGLYSPLSYKEKQLTRKLIHFFKYPPYYLKDLANPLSSLIIDHLLLLGKKPEELLENAVLIPVPLDKKKIKQRGYNQSEEMAKEISKITKTPMLKNVLVKTRITPSQMELSEQERRKNLENAFICQNAKLIKAKKVFLIDDIYTTGSTMEECSRVLRKAGAKEVWGIAIARD
ncbi:ComF family protein [Patescibacteria group bacterium]|nr:ComF family protein [Patescibacteria group bacterium]